MIKNAIILVLAIAVCLLACVLVYDKYTEPAVGPNIGEPGISVVGPTIGETDISVVDPVVNDLEKMESIAERFGDKLEGMGISKEAIDNMIEDVKEYNKTAEYIVAVEIQNVTVPMLKTTLHLPTDDIFYNSVEIGDILTEEQLASLNVPEEYLTGWQITIVDKMTREVENPTGPEA